MCCSPSVFSVISKSVRMPEVLDLHAAADAFRRGSRFSVSISPANRFTAKIRAQTETITGISG